MTKDFAKKTNNPKKSGAQKKSTTSNSSIPGWVWLFTGVVVGLFVAFLVFLGDLTPEAVEQNQQDKKQIAKEQKKEKQTKPRFEFYTMLPADEVVVPQVDEYSIEARKKIQNKYLLQAGSFRSRNDADRLRAELILAGLDTQIDAVDGSKGTWHRVQVGPFMSRSRLNKAQDMLASMNIESLLVRVN